MKSPVLAVLIAAVLVGAGFVVWSARGSGPAAEVTFPNPARAEAGKAPELKRTPIGMAGCLAAACHGAPAKDALAGRIDMSTWQSSGSCWLAADPHTAAYSLLTDHPHRPVKVTAAQIMKGYAKDSPNKRAIDDARCVACHTNPSLAHSDRFGDPHSQALRNEGVSCEACHGNAGAWVTAHTTWRGPREKVCEETGMTRLYDLGERAANCLGCHVGAPADESRGYPVRDMNHDMIAAGHPRLNFDFAEYLRRIPPHWQEKDRATEPPRERALNPAKAWYVGRVAHAEAACRLLADRAEKSAGDESRPWPEFAEYNCATCHHQLKPPEKTGKNPSFRQDAAYLAGRHPGVAPWQTIWPITPAAGIAHPTRDESDLKDLLAQVEKPRYPRAGVPEKARALADALKSRRSDLASTPHVAVFLDGDPFRQDAPDKPALRFAEWDSAAQYLWGRAALERAKGRKQSLPQFQKALAALRTDRWPDFDWPALTSALDAIRKER